MFQILQVFIDGVAVSTLCMSVTLPCVDFMDVILRDVSISDLSSLGELRGNNSHRKIYETTYTVYVDLWLYIARVCYK